MKIALVYAEYKEMTEEIEKINPNADTHMENIVKSITDALTSNGHEVIKVPANIDLLRNIIEIDGLDCIFCHYAPMENLNLQGNVFAALELLGIPIVGSGMFTQALGLSKETTKVILRSIGLPTAKSQVFMTPDDKLSDELAQRFPLFVKPEAEAASVGVEADSYVENEEELRKTLNRIFSEVNPPILVEEYLPGREFTVGVLEEDPVIAIPVMELKFSEDATTEFQSLETKLEKSLIKEVPAKIDDALAKEMQDMAIKAFKALKCDVYGRVDFRLDKHGRPSIIEFNTMPGLEKGKSFFADSCEAIGISYEELINKMVDITMRKTEYDKNLGIGKF